MINNKLWADIDCAAARQYIDSRSAFTAWEEARKTLSLSPDNELTLQRFEDLTATMVRNQRLNWAVYAGRAPESTVEKLKDLDFEFWLDAKRREAVGEIGQTECIVVSDHALYAFEATAGVLIRNDLLPDQESEMFFEQRTSDHERPQLFTAIIISASGYMARMTTISPREFIERKLNDVVKGTLSPEEKIKALNQVELVEQLIEECLQYLMTPGPDQLR